MDLANRDGRRILGERIKRASREAGISLDELAVRIGCSRALIYQYVSGASLAQPDRLQQISAVVGKPLAWFFEDDAAPSASAAGDRATQVVATVDVSRADAAVPPGSDRHSRDRIGYLRELVAAYSSSPDWRQVADACQQLAVLYREHGAPEEIAEVFFTHGNALLRLQEFGPAKIKLEDARGAFAELGLTSRSLDCLQSIGGANVHLGRAKQALREFQMVSAGPEWHHRWQGMLSMGAAHEMLGDYSAAADSLLRAQEVIGENSDSRATEYAYLYVDANWANLELAWADYPRALETAERCVAAAQRLGDQEQYLEGLLNSAAAHQGLGQFRRAAVESEKAVDVAQLVRDFERWSLGLASRSLSFTSCRMMNKALVDAKEALSIALRHGCHRAEILAQKAITQAYLAMGNLDEARYHVDQALAAAQSGGLRLPGAEFQVLSASISRAAGDFALASTLARAAQSEADVLDAKQVRHDASLVLAELSRDTGDWQSAMAHARSAAEYASQMQAEWQAWRSQSILAEGHIQAGNPEDAELSFATALSALDGNRRAVFEASGVDGLPDASGVRQLWTAWVAYLESAERAEEAVRFIEEAQWELLGGWVEEMRKSG